MEMYTEVLVKATLKYDLSEDVYNIIDYMFGDGEKPKVLPDHKFFTLPRWHRIGRCSSWYHHPTPVNSIIKECTDVSITDWYIFSRSDFKNYDNEIDAFFDWFRTIIDVEEGTCIGYTWYEKESQPVLVLM